MGAAAFPEPWGAPDQAPVWFLRSDALPPLITFLSPVIFFIAAQCHLLREAVLTRSNTTVWGSYGSSCLFYEHLQWLQVSGLPLTVP